MARPRNDTPIDLTTSHDLTAGLIERLRCPDGSVKVLLRDRKVPGLKVRCTNTQAKSYVFEVKQRGRTISKTIGSVAILGIEEARGAALKLASIVNQGIDPRELARERAAREKEETYQRDRRLRLEVVTVQEAWTSYLADRKPHWGERHYADHVALSKAGGDLRSRGKPGQKITIDGPLRALMPTRLADLTAEVIEHWAVRETKTRPARARLSWRCLTVFLRWCGEHPEYKTLFPTNPAKTRKTRELLGPGSRKQDALQKEQLPSWFDAVGAIPNRVISAYLQTILLTGARPGEVLSLRWSDLNWQWESLTIRDKVEGRRVIPMTPYVSSLLASLPRRSDWVFSSDSIEGATISPPRSSLVDACQVAGIPHLTMQGLRRSFGSLAEWLDAPVGVVAQIMGHKPSATAERHYRVRPLDLLRVHHKRIEQWILNEAGVLLESSTTVKPGLRLATTS